MGVDWPVRLFRRSKGQFRPVSVHESIQVDGRVERLNAPLLHYSYHSIEEYNEKCDHYTTLAADDLYKKGRRFSFLDHLRPGWELFNRIVLHGAWLDGRAGLTYAVLSSRAAWIRSMKLRALDLNQH